MAAKKTHQKIVEKSKKQQSSSDPKEMLKQSILTDLKMKESLTDFVSKTKKGSSQKVATEEECDENMAHSFEEKNEKSPNPEDQIMENEENLAKSIGIED